MRVRLGLSEASTPITPAITPTKVIQVLAHVKLAVELVGIVLDIVARGLEHGFVVALVAHELCDALVFHEHGNAGFYCGLRVVLLGERFLEVVHFINIVVELLLTGAELIFGNGELRSAVIELSLCSVELSLAVIQLSFRGGELSLAVVYLLLGGGYLGVCLGKLRLTVLIFLHRGPRLVKRGEAEVAQDAFGYLERRVLVDKGKKLLRLLICRRCGIELGLRRVALSLGVVELCLAVVKALFCRLILGELFVILLLGGVVFRLTGRDLRSAGVIFLRALTELLIALLIGHDGLGVVLFVLGAVFLRLAQIGNALIEYIDKIDDIGLLAALEAHDVRQLVRAASCRNESEYRACSEQDAHDH